MVGSYSTTFEVGDRSVADIMTDAERLAKQYGDDDGPIYVGEYMGNVTWASRDRPTIDTPPPEVIGSPQVIGTHATDDGHTALGTLYRVQDDSYHEVEHFAGFWHDLNKVSDYFLINYGTAPQFGESSLYDALPDEDGRLPELRTSADDRPEWWLTPSAHGLDTIRNRIGRDVSLTEPVVDTLLDADTLTQRLTASVLWQPLELSERGQPTQEAITELARLVDADAPELRAAGIHGAGVVLGELVVAIEDGDPVDGEVLEYEQISPAIESFYDAYATALTDPHPLVRGRATGMAVEPLAGAFESTVAFIGDDPLWNCLSDSVHHTVSDALRAAGDDEVSAVATRIADFLDFSDWTDNLVS